MTKPSQPLLYVKNMVLAMIYDLNKKSAIIICRGKYMKNVYPPLYTLNGEVIKEVDRVRYLGHIICNNGKDDKDIMRQCQQLYARGNVLHLY